MVPISFVVCQLLTWTSPERVRPPPNCVRNFITAVSSEENMRSGPSASPSGERMTIA